MPSLPLQPGTLLAHYRLNDPIGQGGSGVVYRAWNTHIECEVAIKVLTPDIVSDPQARKRLRKEALLLSKLNHPNIAIVHDFDTHQGIDFLVMEYVSGDGLDDLLRAGALPETQVIDLGMQLSAGLEAAHQSGIIHRDLKPANLRLLPDGRLKILDFGLAHNALTLDDSATTETVSSMGVAGTLPYIPPEVLRGAAPDKRSDLYSMGVVLWELASGRRPFQARAQGALVDEILHHTPPSLRSFNHTVSSGLEQVIYKAMEKDPQLRYQTSREVGVDLRRLTEPVSLPRAPDLPSRGSRVRKPFLVALGAAVLMAVGLWSWRPWAPPPSSAPTPRMASLVTWPGEETDARLSPDKTRLAFLANRTEQTTLWMLRFDGSEPRQIAAGRGRIFSLAWSPDGRGLAIVLLNDEDTLLQIVSPEDGAVTRSLRVPRSITDGLIVRWYGEHLYFSVPEEDEPATRLVRFDLQSEELEEVLGARHPELGDIRHVDLCSDESTVVFTTIGQGHQVLWTLDLPSGDVQRLTEGTHDEFRARWGGQDCASIVYSSTEGGQSDLWRMQVDSGERHRITFSTDEVLVEDVSHDGSMVVFREDLETSNMWLVDSQSATQITADGQLDRWASAPRSTSQLVFQRRKQTPDRAPGLLDSRIYWMDLAAAKGDLNALVEDGGAALISPDAGFLSYVTRSDQVSERGQFYEMWMANVASGHTWVVTDSFSVGGLYPFPLDWSETKRAWSPPGDRLYFVQVSPEGQRILVTEPPVESARRVYQAQIGDLLGDLWVSPDSRNLAFSVSDLGMTRMQGRLLDLESGDVTVLLQSTEEWPYRISISGWIDEETLIAMRTRLNNDWTESAQILEVDMQGGIEVIAEVERVFAGAACLSAANRQLYMTRVESGGAVHNLVAVGLDGGGVERLTRNQIPGVSYSGLTTLQDGRLVYSRYEQNGNLGLIRFPPE